MPQADRKRKAILLGTGKYYDPVTSPASLKHNARVLFLQAVEKRTPEVLKSLHHDVWPFYESLYRRVFHHRVRMTGCIPSTQVWFLIGFREGTQPIGRRPSRRHSSD